MLDFAGWYSAKKIFERKIKKIASIFPCGKVGWMGGSSSHPSHTFSPRAVSAPLAHWQGGYWEHGDRMWLFRWAAMVNDDWLRYEHPAPPTTSSQHGQSRCITCTLLSHVGQAWYSPQTTNFMCHDEDVAKIELASLRGQS